MPSKAPTCQWGTLLVSRPENGFKAKPPSLTSSSLIPVVREIDSTFMDPTSDPNKFPRQPVCSTTVNQSQKVVFPPGKKQRPFASEIPNEGKLSQAESS